MTAQVWLNPLASLSHGEVMIDYVINDCCPRCLQCVDMVIQLGFMSFCEKCVNCFEKCVKTQRNVCESNEKTIAVQRRCEH